MKYQHEEKIPHRAVNGNLEPVMDSLSGLL